jgi:hypothetical protein
MNRLPNQLPEEASRRGDMEPKSHITGNKIIKMDKSCSMHKLNMHTKLEC